MSSTHSHAIPLYSPLCEQPELIPLVNEFVQALPDRLEAIERALNHGDWRSATSLLHQLKGSAGSYGFDLLSEQAMKLEHAVLDECELPSILDMLQELRALVQRVRPGRARPCS